MSQAEEFIKKNTKDCSNQYDFPEYFENGIKRLKEYQPWLSPDDAKKAVEIAREEMLNDICEWIGEQKDLLEDSFSDPNDFADILKQEICQSQYVTAASIGK